jgi:hypothetical protein
MDTLLYNEKLKYDGSQLSAHFAFRKFGILGDSIVAFIGPCEVKIDAMVDIEDVRRDAPIFSREMLSFIFESFAFDLKAAAAFQRLMVCIAAERLAEQKVAKLLRKGDDLFVEGRKLSVSIAAASPVSTLIHLGLNIDAGGAPVPAVGLSEFGVDIQAYAALCLNSFRDEYQSLLKATWKVRPVK